MSGWKLFWQWQSTARSANSSSSIRREWRRRRRRRRRRRSNGNRKEKMRCWLTVETISRFLLVSSSSFSPLSLSLSAVPSSILIFNDLLGFVFPFSFSFQRVLITHLFTLNQVMIFSLYVRLSCWSIRASQETKQISPFLHLQKVFGKENRKRCVNIIRSSTFSSQMSDVNYG